MKQLFFWGFILLQFSVYAQEIVPFTIRKQENLKGGLKIIGNNILSHRPANQPFNLMTVNDDLNMDYVDIDNDTSTFSSSAATLSFHNNDCSKIRYAGLYWGGMYAENDDSKKNIQIKIPSNPNYINIEADSYIYNHHTSDFPLSHKPYICYKDITHLISAQNPAGEYIVANVKATQSGDYIRVLGGLSAGWALVIIYEDPEATSKYITTFDGYASVSNAQNNNAPTDVAFSFTGFKTLPAPLPVHARFGVIALEGDKQIKGDKLSVQKPDLSYFDLHNTVNPSNNFFNSSISNENEINHQRRPNSTNTLGWDIDLFSIPNNDNSIITNNQTSANFKAHTTQDRFDIFFSAFEVEVIEPKMNLLKTIEDATGNVLNNQTIPLGSTLYYGLEFQNVGNDDALDYQIIDILPEKVHLTTPLLIEIPSGSGITYSLTTNAEGQTQLTFNIPDNLVRENGEKHKIRFAVQLESNCDAFSQPCSEIIANKAYSIYKGNLNRTIINDNGSFSSVDDCNLGTIENTIFYADLSGCNLTQNINDLLCGESLTLTATEGFDSYQWKNATGEIIGNSKNIVVTSSGNYTVFKQKNNCLIRTETYNISTVQRESENPLSLYAGEIFQCTDLKKSFPQIFLCGTNAHKDIDLTHLSNVNSVEVKKYQGAEISISQTCPPTDVRLWQTVFNGKTFTLTQEGIYQITLTFNNGCIANYYFRVHTSSADLLIEKTDINCNDGTINIINAPENYEFTIVLEGDTTAKAFQEQSNFSIKKAGTYLIYARKKERLQSDCEILADKITINRFEQQIQNLTINHESCYGKNNGSVSFKLVNGKAPYKAILKNGRTHSIGEIASITEATITSFDNLPPTDYILVVEDAQKCVKEYPFSVEAASFLDFQVENELICHNNVPTSRLVLTFNNPNQMDLSKVKYQFNDDTQIHYLEHIVGDIAYIYPKLASQQNQTIKITYNEGCSLSKLFNFENNTPIILGKDTDPTLISAIRIKAYGGEGNYKYYINGIKHDSDIYYLRATDEGYTDQWERHIKKIHVRVEDELGCFSERYLEEVFFDIQIPNFFTPDGDGINDVWKIGNALAYKKMKVYIFDRFGRQIAVISSDRSWDGTWNNTPLPSGDYWFKIDFNDLKDKRIYIGNFTLYR
ncbi:T9SS type B sorting domain-containing protein [Capnocytophaga canimorsus]|uniref:T9SS type B sorting domain-containing protein n=1 Tax=Capnocytophaga canimorsus TaxID=28188 RepID=UPI0038587C1A